MTNPVSEQVEADGFHCPYCEEPRPHYQDGMCMQCWYEEQDALELADNGRNTGGKTYLPKAAAASSARSPAPVTEEQIARVVCCPRGCIFADVQGEKCLAMSHNHETRAAVLKLIAPQPPSGEIGCAVVCDASKFDGVICADDECDIANGTRQAPPAKGEQAALPATDDAELVGRRETSKKLLDIVDRITALSAQPMAADDAELVRRLLSAEADTSVDLDETYDLLRKAADRITALSASRDTAGLVKALEKIAGQADNNWTRVIARAALASHAKDKS